MNKNISDTLSSSSTDFAGRGKRNFWQWLVEPPAVITDVTERRQARLVSTLLLALVLAISSGPIIQFYVLRQPTSAFILAGMGLGYATAYALSRTTNGNRLAVPLLLATSAAWPILSITLETNYSPANLLITFIFDVLLILFSSALASFRTTIFISAANFLGILLVPILFPDVQFGNIAIPLSFNGVVSVLILIFTNHRNLVEKDRLLEMERINSALQASNADLNARKRDMNLAVEVGRSVSQVRTLDIMMKEAAELIRAQFDLYYVQVYLVNPAQNRLTLQSGTGEVGAALLERKHSLSIDSNSINGRAVLQKKAQVISDTTTSAAFKPNPLLPKTRSEIAVPLLVGETVVGALDIQSEIQNSLVEETLPAFEALAGQLAIAIQSANLLAEAEEARKEVETQARRLSRTNWLEYLDAIHSPEQIGYAFENNTLSALNQQAEEDAAEGALVAPIAVSGETLGNLTVDMKGETTLPNAKELVHIVARQVAQQIENLRLLESAERYRLEAEQASRRLTHEGWEEYMGDGEKNVGYLYDLKEVRPYKQEEAEPADDVSVPLKVRDTTIGKLILKDINSSDSEAIEIASAVAERLSAHIEGLRLSMQTENALATTKKQAEREQALRQITSAVRGSTDPEIILRTAARELGSFLGRKAAIFLQTSESRPETDSALIPNTATPAGGEQ